MYVLVRALTYAVLFIGLLLVYVPSRVLSWSGVSRPGAIALPQVIGIAMTSVGGLLALACVLTFAVVGRGTPAPFDPPRCLVARGPYRFTRNPMYIGAGLALAGAGLFYRSTALFGYAILFLVAAHVFVVGSKSRRCDGTSDRSTMRTVGKLAGGGREHGGHRGCTTPLGGLCRAWQ